MLQRLENAIPVFEAELDALERSLGLGGPRAVSPDERPYTGCIIELIAIDVKANAETWLTFGFEAFGPSSRVTALLDEAVHGPAPVRLDKRDSPNYPTWLARLR